MHLTKRTDYGIRVLMYCAINKDSTNPVSQIAKSCGISELFLFKILHLLITANIVETVRGRSGGVRLCRPADQITVLDVVKATEDSFHIAECFDSTVTCPLMESCNLNLVLHKALNAFFDVLQKYTIEYLVRDNSQFKDIFNIKNLSFVHKLMPY
ncbi:MAG: iron-responsive transcriptional regulator RirA [Candidatus Liberibacter ctenarytainae]|uniref:Iron-responsive transcriptional regulator RirA n=1 Tax=Candidatus Liberibacter ctenarytainae TaxID=2020335 RepID=A0A937ACC7_9HYPH|nr:iron-responsive transcriptional regulator RirA [Candidatus Liberibacter ctenarytainae]